MSRFDPQRALDWLQRAAVDDDGRILSWVNPARPGFAYPEAAAIVLRLLDGSPHADATIVQRIAARLRRDVDLDRVGKDGRPYAFDLGVALAGLADADPSWVGRLRARVLAAVDDPRSFEPLPDGTRRWSTTRGPHLLKLAVPLLVSARALGCDPRLDAITAIGFEQAPNGRIETPPHRATYVHAHCYAAEGLLALAHAADSAKTARSRAVAAIRWLAEIQDPDGSLPAWHDGRRPRGPCPADSCAQAIRLWCILDAREFAEPIRRGLAYLDRLTHEVGALRYHADSDDLNTWATAFAVQAATWARHGRADAPVALL